MASAVVKLQHCVMEVSHWTSSNRLKLNANKTELLWAGSRRGCPSLGDCSPLFKSEQTQYLQATTFECSEWHSRQIWPWTSMSPICLLNWFLSLVAIATCVAVIWLGWSQRRCSLMPSSRPALTTVMYCWQERRRLRSTSFSIFWIVSKIRKCGRGRRSQPACRPSLPWVNGGIV